MCLGVPGKVIEVNESAGTVNFTVTGDFPDVWRAVQPWTSKIKAVRTNPFQSADR